MERVATGNQVEYLFNFSTGDIPQLGLMHADRTIGGTYSNVVIMVPDARVHSTIPQGVNAVENGSVSIPYSRIEADGNRLSVTVKYVGKIPEWMCIALLCVAFWMSTRAERGSRYIILNIVAVAIGVALWGRLGDALDQTLDLEDSRLIAPALITFGIVGTGRCALSLIRGRKEAR